MHEDPLEFYRANKYDAVMVEKLRLDVAAHRLALDISPADSGSFQYQLI